MSGWVKLHRSLLDWEWYSDCNVVYTFIHLLIEANWEDKKWRGMVIPRGSLVTSVSKLAESLRLTIRQTRTVLDKLKKTNNVSIETTNGYSLISIVNYDFYQNNIDDTTSDTTSNTADERQTNDKRCDKRTTTTKESKNQEYNNLNNISSLRSDIFTNPPVSEDEPEKPKKEYVFDGKVIHLIQKHYDDWQKAFPNLNLYAELVSRDDWLATQPLDVQKKWFPSTAQYLGKRDGIRKSENKNKPHDEFLPHSNLTEDTENEEEWYL